MGIKGYLIAGFILIVLIASCGILRNWRKIWNPRPPRPPWSWSFGVESIPNGATVIVYTGRKDRRTAVISLSHIAAPPSGHPYFDASKASLEALAGTRVRVESGSRLMFAEPDAVESRAPAIGIVYGESGVCCNFEQVAAGMATCLPSAPAGWKDAEVAAKELKIGLWK